MKTFLTFTFALVISLNSFSQTGAGRIITGDVGQELRDILDQLFNKADGLMYQADIMTKNRVKELLLGLNSFKFFIENERAKTMGDLDQLQRDMLTRIDNILAERIPNHGEISEFSALLSANFQNAINTLPFSENQYFVYDIQGIGIKHERKDLYQIRIISNLPNGSDIDVRFFVDNIQRSSLNGRSDNERYIEIPSSEFGPLFQDTSVHEVDFRLLVTKRRRLTSNRTTLIDFNTKILLFPKYPVEYKLSKICKTNRWVETNEKIRQDETITRTQDKTIELTLADTKKRINKSKIEYFDRVGYLLSIRPGCANICELLPQCCQNRGGTNNVNNGCCAMISRTPYVTSTNFSNNDRTIQVTYRSPALWGYTTPIPIYIRVGLDELIPGPDKYTPIRFINDNKFGERTFLGYGDFNTNNLGADCNKFELKVKWFYSNQWINPEPEAEIRQNAVRLKIR
jgi:hypothetical protein